MKYTQGHTIAQFAIGTQQIAGPGNRITVSVLSFGLQLDSPAVTQAHVAAPDVLSFGLMIDGSVVCVQNHVISSINTLSFATTFDSPAVTQVHNVSPATLFMPMTFSNVRVVVREGGYLFITIENDATGEVQRVSFEGIEDEEPSA